MSRLTGRMNRVAARVPASDQPDLTAEAAAYGELVSNEPYCRIYLRRENGEPVSTLLAVGPYGTSGFELVGVDAAHLL